MRRRDLRRLRQDRERQRDQPRAPLTPAEVEQLLEQLRKGQESADE